MTVSRSGGVSSGLLQVAVYRGDIAPAVARIGDLWFDTVAGLWKYCNSESPVTFTPIDTGGGGGGSVTSAELQAVIDRVSANSADLTSFKSFVSAQNAGLSLRADSLADRISANSADVTSLKSFVSAQDAALSLRIDSTNADLGSLKSLVSAADAALSIRVDSVNNRVSANSADVTSLKDRVSANSADLTSFKSFVSAQDAGLSVRIDSLGNRVSQLSTDVLSADAVLSQRIDSLVNRVSANSGGGGGGGSLTSAEVFNAISALADRVSANSADVTSLKSFVSAADAALSVRIDSTNNRISAISTDLTSVKDRVSLISADVTSLRSVVQANSADVTSLKDRVSGISADVTSIRSVVQANSADVTSLKSFVSALGATLSGRIDSTNNRISAISGDLTSAKDRLSLLSTDVTSLKSLVSAQDALLSQRIDSLVNRVSANSGGGGGGGPVSLTSGHIAFGGAANTLSMSPFFQWKEGKAAFQVNYNSATGAVIYVSAPGSNRIMGANTSAAGGVGGEIIIQGGFSDAGEGGSLLLQGGGTLTDAGGDITIDGGDGITFGGNVAMRGGDASSGSGGQATLQAGIGTSNGGGVDVIAGAGNTGSGGEVNIEAGIGAQVGGNVNIKAGDNFVTGGFNGAAVIVTGGNTVSAPVAGNAGDILFRPGIDAGGGARHGAVGFTFGDWASAASAPIINFNRFGAIMVGLGASFSAGTSGQILLTRSSNATPNWVSLDAGNFPVISNIISAIGANSADVTSLKSLVSAQDAALSARIDSVNSVVSAMSARTNSLIGTRVLLSADQAKTASAVSAINGLSVALTTGAVYEFELFVPYSMSVGGVGPGPTFRLSASGAGFNWITGAPRVPNTAGVPTFLTIVSANSQNVGVPSTPGASGQVVHFKLEGAFRTSTGTAPVLTAKAFTTSIAMTMKAGAYLDIRRML